MSIENNKKTAAVRRYNDKTYDIIAIRIPKNTAAAFKAKCREKGVAQAAVVKEAIDKFLTVK